MKKRKVNDVRVIQYSKSNPEKNEQMFALVFYEKIFDTISFAYNEDGNHRVYVTGSENQLAIMRTGDSNTFCRFVEEENTPLIKDSEFGTHLFVSKTNKIINENGIFHVEYDLFMLEECVDSFVMTWEIENNEK